MHFWIFGLVTLWFFWPQLKLKVWKSKCLNLWKSLSKARCHYWKRQFTLWREAECGRFVECPKWLLIALKDSVSRSWPPLWQWYDLQCVSASTGVHSWYAHVHGLFCSPSFSSPHLTSSLGLVKDAARPAYWVPDHEILHCHNCRKEFSIKLSKHHCRACGQGFCDECSHDRRAVPSRGWDHPVRVCFNCNKKPGDL